MPHRQNKEFNLIAIMKELHYINFYKRIITDTPTLNVWCQLAQYNQVQRLCQLRSRASRLQTSRRKRNRFAHAYFTRLACARQSRNKKGRTTLLYASHGRLRMFRGIQRRKTSLFFTSHLGRTKSNAKKNKQSYQPYYNYTSYNKTSSFNIILPYLALH